MPRGVIDKVAAAYWYLFYTGSVMVAVTTFCMLKIVPAMIKIFDDFNAELPGATIVLINISDAFVTFWPLSLLLQFAVVGLFVYVALRYFGAIHWDPPLVSALVRRWNLATVLRTAAIAAEANQPLEAGLVVLARTYPNRALRNQLIRTLGDISLGANWRQSFQQHGLLREREAAMLETAARAGNLPWALRETAAGMERQCAHRVRAFFQLLTPVVVLALGGMTSLIVIGLFVPLITLIERLL